MDNQYSSPPLNTGPTSPTSTHFRSGSHTGDTRASLFGDDVDNDRMWSPSARKPSHRNRPSSQQAPAYSVGAFSDLPSIYYDIYEFALEKSAVGKDKAVTFSGVAAVLSRANLSPDSISLIRTELAIRDEDDFSLSREQFFVLLSLIALAQTNREVSYDEVTRQIHSLPIPSLDGFQPHRPATEPDVASLPSLSPQRQTTHTSRIRRDSNHYAPNNANPWSSVPPPQHFQPPVYAPSRPSNAMDPHAAYLDMSASMVSGQSIDPLQDAMNPSPIAADPSPSWNSLETTLSTPNPLISNIGQPSTTIPDRHPTLSRLPQRARELIVVGLIPEKEGFFLFQHHNYEVSSQRRGSKVIRRYSDFVWLLESLHIRYPFRALPLLPPKRVAVNGNHFSNDGAFIEKRRRGLARFLNALISHPILSQEHLVDMFLTVPTELSVWRKQSSVTVQDEFTGRVMTPGLEASLPPTIEDTFNKTRVAVKKSAEVYTTICALLDRLVKRTEGVAADHGRLALSLVSLIDAHKQVYAVEANEDLTSINDGVSSLARHLRNCQNLLEDESKAWDAGMLEDLKRQRDALVSIRDMFDRRDRLDRDNIPVLERRIEKNRERLTLLRDKPEGETKAQDVQKLAEAITKDEQSIEQQYNRSVFIKKCLRDELRYFQASQYQITNWSQDWAQERVKYTEMLADNWRQLLNSLEAMPLGE